ncbi:MAG: hypothetical protein FJ011_02640 [Chloroflexi bacterium]|nr:hypothetical protein [Chloroflexota bacterium]
MTAPPLREAIDGFRANELSAVLYAAGVRDVPKSKQSKVDLWTRLMADPARIQQALSKLTPRGLKALQALQALGSGEVRASRYRAVLERAKLLEAQTRQRALRYAQPTPENATDPVTFEEILAALLKYGLIWSHTPGGAMNSKLGFEGGFYVYIPSEVAIHLPPPPPQARPAVQVGFALPGSARTCQRDLYLYWSAVRETPLQLTANTNLLRVSDLKRITPTLLVTETLTTGIKESDFRRLLFLRRLLTALGMLKSELIGGAYTLSGEANPSFLNAEPTGRVRACFECWRDGAWWNELWTTYVQGQTRASGSVADLAPPAVRQARLKALEALIATARRASEWIAFDDLFAALQDRDYEFLVDRETAETQNRHYAYYRTATYSPYHANKLGWSWEAHTQDNEAAWNAIEGGFVRAAVIEGLYWLGLVDLGYAAEVTPAGGAAPAGAIAFRLNDMGRWLLLDGPQPAIPAESGRVVLQPNFHVFAFDPIPDSVLARLDSFATRLRAERAMEYEITRDSIYRAQLAGASAAEIKAWLSEVTAAALPQNVERSLDEWQTAFERIVIRPRVGVVQTADSALADAMMADDTLRPAILKRVAPNTLLIRPEMAEQVERTLLVSGELPVRARAAEDAHRGSISVNAAGEIQFAQAAPSLYVCGFLQPFADQSDGRWRVTAASVRRASRAGLEAAAILSELEALAAAPTPADLQTNIKAWCKHYGNASVHTLTLIQFRDQDALDELLADPDLAAVLTPFKPAAKLGLASVRPEDLEGVRKMLDERGVELRGSDG